MWYAITRRRRGVNSNIGSKVLGEWAAEIKSLHEPNARGHSKRICALRSSKRYGRCVGLTRTGKPTMDAARAQAAERLDGKFSVYSDDDSLGTADRAPGYRRFLRDGTVLAQTEVRSQVWQVAESWPSSRKRLKRPEIKALPPILDLA